MPAPPFVGSREWLTAKQVAGILDISERTVYRWLANGKLPQPVRYSPRTVRWRSGDIEHFLESCEPDVREPVLTRRCS